MIYENQKYTNKTKKKKIMGWLSLLSLADEKVALTAFMLQHIRRPCFHNLLLDGIWMWWLLLKYFIWSLECRLSVRCGGFCWTRTIWSICLWFGFSFRLFLSRVNYIFTSLKFYVESIIIKKYIVQCICINLKILFKISNQ